MKRSTLREVVRTLANRKLAEYATICHGENGKCIDPALEEIATEPATGRVPKPPKAKFAYIVNRDDPKDPRMQLIGYGNMPVSYFKKMVLDGLDRMSTAADRGKYDAVISQWNNITKFVVNGLAEVDGVTEPVIRLMVEARSQKIAKETLQYLITAITDLSQESMPSKGPYDFNQHLPLQENI